jgi:hypothetical protein
VNCEKVCGRREDATHEQRLDVGSSVLLAVSLMVLSQQSMPTSSHDSGVMLAAVSLDARMLGMGSGKENAKGAAFVEPLARLTSSGEWQSLPCFADRDGKRYAANQQEACSKFEREYLSKPHTYTVVSADGRGAKVNAPLATLTECSGYTEKEHIPVQILPLLQLQPVPLISFPIAQPRSLFPTQKPSLCSKHLLRFVSGGLDSTLHLKVFSLRLEGQDLTIVQRSYVKPAGTKLIFAIGKMDQDRFQILHWKENVGDEDEVVLGVVHLTNGREFLITTVTDPEGQWFRAYGIRQGKLMMVYSGGGSSC